MSCLNWIQQFPRNFLHCQAPRRLYLDIFFQICGLSKAVLAKCYIQYRSVSVTFANLPVFYDVVIAAFSLGQHDDYKKICAQSPNVSQGKYSGAGFTRYFANF